MPLLEQLHRFLLALNVAQKHCSAHWTFKITLHLIRLPALFGSFVLLFFQLVSQLRRKEAYRYNIAKETETGCLFQGTIAGVCDDSLAEEFLSWGHFFLGLNYILKSIATEQYTINAAICGRCRYVDLILKQRPPDIEQIIILGAGNDTRLHRLPNLPSALFEVDTPRLQAVKRKKLGKYRNPNVTFVSAEIAHGTWWTALVEAGFDPLKKSLIICEGMTVHMASDTIVATLTAISRCTNGTLVVLDYLSANTIVIDNTLRKVREFLWWETLSAFYRDDEFVDMLEDSDMTIIESAQLASKVEVDNVKVGRKVKSMDENILSLKVICASVMSTRE